MSPVGTSPASRQSTGSQATAKTTLIGQKVEWGERCERPSLIYAQI